MASKVTTKITVTINRRIKEAFADFAHPAFGLRRDGCLNNWLAKALEELRDDRRTNSEEGMQVLADLRRNAFLFGKRVPLPVTLSESVATALDTLCTEKKIPRDLFIEVVLENLLLGYGENVTLSGPPEEEGGPRFTWQPYGPLEAMIRSLTLPTSPKDVEVMGVLEADEGGVSREVAQPPFDRLFVTAHEIDAYRRQDLAGIGKGISPFSDWLFLRALWYHTQVADSEYADPDELAERLGALPWLRLSTDEVEALRASLGAPADRKVIKRPGNLLRIAGRFLWDRGLGGDPLAGPFDNLNESEDE
jgi:hypothetical protein